MPNQQMDRQAKEENKQEDEDDYKPGLGLGVGSSSSASLGFTSSSNKNTRGRYSRLLREHKVNQTAQGIARKISGFQRKDGTLARDFKEPVGCWNEQNTS